MNHQFFLSTPSWNMRNSSLLASTIVVLASCMSPAPTEGAHEVDALFAQNCETAKALIRDFDNEELTAVQGHFADSALWLPTKFGQTDTASLQDKLQAWESAWATYDFNLATEELRLLPGVNAETKEVDGSVRVYFDWEVVRPATDSTDRKAVMISYYESWDFDAAGKIWLTQIYGDATAAMQALNGM